MTKDHHPSDSAHASNSAAPKPTALDASPDLYQGSASHDTRSLSDTSRPATSGTADRAPADLLPEQFGRYRVIRALGKGGMGAVYLARDTELDRLVAIKVPFLDQSDQQSVLERFRREAKAVAMLQHPNICPVFDVAQIGDVHFMAMAYIQGKSLADLLPTQQTLPIRSVVMLVRRLALALFEAHSRGVVHRDLKPSNIMIDERGQPIIMDFGLARRGDSVDTQLTNPGQLIGTPSYMAPEQVAGDMELVGPGCDIYSLGVILYQLLTDQLPFSGDLLSVLSQIANAPPRPPSQIRSEIPKQIETICLRAMMKDPGDRFESMRQFAGALTEFLLSDNSGVDVSSSDSPKTESDLDTSSTIDIFARWSEEELAIAATSAVGRTKSKIRKIAVGVAAVAGVFLLIGGGVLFSQWGNRASLTAESATSTTETASLASVDVIGMDLMPISKSAWRQPDPTTLPDFFSGARVYTKQKRAPRPLEHRNILGLPSPSRG